MAGEFVTILLRWADNWLGASRDLDLFIAPLDARGNLVLTNAFTSEFDQLGRSGDIPWEIISVPVISDLTACVAVRQHRGAAPAWMHLASFRNQSLEFHTLAGGIANPSESANPGLLAVGAAPWSNTSSIEPFSDQGPTPDGRIKPDIVGADRGQTVSYRSVQNPNGYFFGTSQASPHVAGLAALVKQRFPSYSPQQVANYLKSNAEARGAVPNNTWGYGFAKLPASDTVAPTPVPTATPVTAPTVPVEVLNRISALETLVATLQGLISTLEGSISALNSNVSALTSRVAALETGASIPTPVPTPTIVPGETPVPTPSPVPGETPVPTPTQTPVPDACLTSIPSDGATNGSWNSACTTDRDIATANALSGTRNAGYYTFALSQQSEVTITLESSKDTYLFLLSGHGRNGEKVAENDDIDTPRRNYNSRIVETLAAGEYTILATTYDLASQPGGVGDFTLTVDGIQ
ncbi:MAG: S8 family serine peptidase [Chloroflexi bacterium]|nr:S8 family serine peptidase [Chloroflexota bacterium]